jgi:cytochrome c-type biogenesis protein
MNFILLLLASFVAGLLTFIAPCTLPLLPAYLANLAGSAKGKTITRTLFFCLGFSIMFLIIGFTAGSLGKLILIYKREVILGTGIALILFGIIAVFGIALKVREFHSSNKFAVLFGLIFGMTWTGCIGPILGIMLVLAASTQTALMGALLLLVYAWGLLTPLIVLSFAADKLVKTGKLWTMLKGKLFELKIGKRVLYIHSTNLIAGAFFILVGILMLLNREYNLSVLFPDWATEWTFDLQEKIAEIIQR